MTTERRQPMTISLSPANPDAVVVAKALAEVPDRRRSATLLSWAASYLEGRALAAAEAEEFTLDDEDLDAKLDDF